MAGAVSVLGVDATDFAVWCYMSTPLRDQLLKAGLVSEKQAREAEKQARKQPRKRPKSAAAQKPTAGQQAAQAKAARDRELNRRKAEKAEAGARAAQIRQIIDQHRVPSSEDGEPFHFQDGAHIKRVHVSAEQRRKLIDGSLAIARYGKSFALVPREIAGKLSERDPQAVVNLEAATGTRSEDEEEAYRGFEVPDDLIW